jgi:enterochelin esterase-like enzyme
MKPSRIVDAEFTSELIPRPMPYGVLLPDGYDDTEESFPLLYDLYPAVFYNEGSTRLKLAQMMYRQLWNDGRLPRMVVVAPSVDVSLYLNHGAGAEKWEQLLIGPFLSHLRKEYRLWPDRRGLLATGRSAGGAITLRLGLKYPEVFGGIAPMEPGIEAAFAVKDIAFEDKFWRSPRQYENIDEEAWALNNPLNIAVANAEKIRSYNPGIYLECGDEDSFRLHRGTELMHRVLWDNGIPHEYHLVRGADHLGSSLGPRTQEALAFLGKLVNPPPPDPIVQTLRMRVGAVREQAEKMIPNDPKLGKLIMAIMTDVRRQSEQALRQLENR